MLHILKIDYDNLTVKEVELVHLKKYSTGRHFDIIPDQLNDQKFVLNDYNQIFMGCIQNDKLALHNVKNTIIDFGYKRLVDSKCQGFTCKLPRKFIEIDLETTERKEIDASVVLEDDESEVLNCWVSIFVKIKFNLKI